MKRQLLAAVMLLSQIAMVSAVNKPNGTVRGSRSNKGGLMQRGGEHMLAGFEAPIKNGDVEAFNKHLAEYKGGKLGLYALVGKLAIAVDENHADTSISQGDMATRTRHLHQMRDAVLEKLKTHTSSRPNTAEGRKPRQPRGERKSPANKKASTGTAQRNGKLSRTATKKAPVKKAAEEGMMYANAQ